MLSISAMKADQIWYYINLAKEDYYTKGNEAPGFWLGGGAEKLGLHGTVDPDALYALYQGFSPDGRPLVKNAGHMQGDKCRQPGVDKCFSVPKSVSVVWSQAAPEIRQEIQDAIHAAVAAVIKELERTATYSRIGKGGTKRIRSELVVAAFPHGTSRALDPGYHVHCVCVNLGVSEDGKTRTILSKPFYENKMLAGSLFRAHLAHELQERLGLETYRPLNRNGDPQNWFELKGVPKELCEEFSKRRKAIEAKLGAGGLETASAAASAALTTRQRKPVIPPRHQLFQDWRKVGQLFGFTRNTIDQLIGKATTYDQKIEYRKILNQAVDQLTSSNSDFSERQLLTQVLNASQGIGLDPVFACDSVRKDLKSSRDFVTFGARNTQTLYTTTEVIDIEKEFLQAADALSHKNFQPIPDRVVERLINRTWSADKETKSHFLASLVGMKRVQEKGFKLNNEQADALRYVTQFPGRLKSISGLAGTGKTTMLRAAKEAFEKQGYQVFGCAVAGVAAKRLQEGSGIQSDTVRMRLLELYPRPWQIAKHHVKQLIRAARHKPTYEQKTLSLNRKTVLVADEAGQIGTRDFALLAKAAERKGAILLCVGDEKQLPSVEMGGGFAGIIKRHGCARLEDITRQRKPSERKAVEQLSRGEGEQVLRDYTGKGQLNVAENRDKAREELISHWKSAGGVTDPAKHLIFVATNQEVDLYNERAQRERVRSGQLDTSQSIRLGSETLFVGDRVICLKKSRPLNLENGDTGTVVAVRKTPLGHDLAMRLDGEQKDRVIPVSRLIGQEYDHLRRGYAFTTHKLQGHTVEHAYVHIGGAMTDREMTYVQGSRHRDTLHLYTDQNEAGVSLTNLAREHTHQPERVRSTPDQKPEYSPLLQQVAKSGAKHLAHDLMQPTQEKENETQQTIEP